MIIRDVSVPILLGATIAVLLYNLVFRMSNSLSFDDMRNEILNSLSFNNVQRDISKVADQAKARATQSWEYEIAAEALLEFYNPELSVFAKDPFPTDKVPSASLHQVESLEFARAHITTASQTLLHDKLSVGDLLWAHQQFS